jgi:hypothetical protein
MRSTTSAIFFGYFLFGQIHNDWTAYRAAYIQPNRPPTYGFYRVETFLRGGREIPPLATDGTHWDWLAAQNSAGLIVLMMDGSQKFYGARYDAPRNRMVLTVRGVEYPLVYSRPDADHLLLEGKLESDLLSVRLRKVDRPEFLLASRGFHWITELPFENPTWCTPSYVICFQRANSWNQPTVGCCLSIFRCGIATIPI